jgi:phosphodiesterase/alkaline phosphatase D-like protein
MAGDFIYEYNTDAAAPAGRNVYPPKEIVTLQDYRLRYQTYHTDPELVRMRAALPLIGKLHAEAYYMLHACTRCRAAHRVFAV